MDRPRNATSSARMGFRVLNVSEPRTADIDIFDIIGDPWDGTTAKDFVTELRSLDVDRINLHINSPGGLVNDGLAMFNAIQQHPAEVFAMIESEAASAASFVAMAADRVMIARNAKMFIHDAVGFGIGNATDFRALVNILEEESQNIASIYDAKAGGGVKKWRDAMQANSGIGSTYRGQAAVDAGLADEVMAVPTRNVEPMRVTAMADPEPDKEPEDEDTFGLAEAMKAAVLPKPTAKLEKLLKRSSLGEAITGAARGGSNGG